MVYYSVWHGTAAKYGENNTSTYLALLCTFVPDVDTLAYSTLMAKKM
jgi:hypothetical protein